MIPPTVLPAPPYPIALAHQKCPTFPPPTPPFPPAPPALLLARFQPVEEGEGHLLIGLQREQQGDVDVDPVLDRGANCGDAGGGAGDLDHQVGLAHGGPQAARVGDGGIGVLGQIGPVHLAVTTNLNINFLKKPGRADLIGEARLLKLGKRLAVGEVSISQPGGEGLVAHATGTYSIPAGSHGRPTSTVL